MTLSLCIVTRNEASFLRECIESARPISDEIVVVDTGSTDATCAIAREAGARLIRAAWPGDLGKAHDLPLAHARGDWVLSLDGDEVLDPESRHQVREFIQSRETDGFVFTVRNYLHVLNSKWRRVDSTSPVVKGALGYTPSLAVRLFRRRRAYQFLGSLHQSIAPSIIAAGGKIESTAVPIHHYGFLRFDRAKSSLYLALARRQVTLEPKSAQAWIDLGIVFLGTERYPSPTATAAFWHARSLGERSTASYFLARALIGLGQPAAAIPYLREAIRRNSKDNLIFFDQADAWELLGLACQNMGHGALAENAYRKALKCRPDSPMALNNLADLLGERDATDAGEQMAERLVGQYRGLSMAWATLGTVRLRAGKVKEACRAFETALSIHAETLPARANLAIAYQRAGRPRKATRAYLLARQCAGSPDARDRKLTDHLSADPPQIIKLRPLGRGAVVSLIESLLGGGGRVLMDGVRALKGRPQLVLCGEGGTYTGQALHAEVECAGVQVCTVTSESDLYCVLAQIQPAAVIHHWWAGERFHGPVRVGAERWIAVGHAALPMPFGYDAYVVISAFHEQFQRHLPSARLVPISNGVRLDQFTGKPRRARASERITIAMVSRLDPGKFPRRLLHYLSPLADLNIRVLVAGFGQRRFEIEPEISRLGLEKIVRFVGSIRSTQIPHFLSQADIGLHLTETHFEICSMTILEMMASGLPIVAEPKGCLPEMIVHGKNGFLATSEREVATYLRELITSPMRRRRMGRAGRTMVQRYDLARFSGALRKLVAAQTRAKHISSVDFGLRRSRRAAQAEKYGRSRDSESLPSSCYLICATPRSGGNLLCEALTNTGIAGSPGEFFARRAERWCLPNWGETADIEQYAAWLFQDRSTPNGVFGAKIMPGQFRDLCAMTTPRRAGRNPHAGLQSIFPGLRYVWMRRRDKLRQAISYVRADQTGQWFQREGGVHLPRPKPRFDQEAIDLRLREIESEERQWLNFFDTSRVTPVTVVYEDLADDYEATAKRTLKQLGISLPRQLWFGQRQLLRQADGRTDDWVRRFKATPIRCNC